MSIKVSEKAYIAVSHLQRLRMLSLILNDMGPLSDNMIQAAKVIDIELRKAYDAIGSD